MSDEEVYKTHWRNDELDAIVDAHEDRNIGYIGQEQNADGEDEQAIFVGIL